MQLSFSSGTGAPDPSSVDLDAPREKRALIGLLLVPGIGVQRVRMLLAAFGAPSTVFRVSRSTLTRVDGIGPQLAEAILTFDDHDAVDRQVERADTLGATLVAPWSDRFPRRLREIYDPPAFLWMRGRLAPSDERAVAVVGTRRCTSYGKAQAYHFGQELARCGVTVVSGLAYGIDAAAHRGALDAGGRTIAVLGSGVGRVYPASHTSLATRIAEDGAGRGAVLSEYAPDAEPDAPHFPERNRIVSGMTLGTLVVESHAKGGALITARMAVEQNREVFAVPGDVNRSASVGANRLIQRGHAKLVVDVDDVLDELPGYLFDDASPTANAPATSTDEDASASLADADRPRRHRRDAAPDLEGAERTLYDALTDVPVHVDALCDQTGVGASEALATLLQLEFKGLVRQLPGKQFQRS